MVIFFLCVLTFAIIFFSLRQAHCRGDPSIRPAWHGFLRYIGSLRQGVPHARQEEEV